MLLMLEDDPDRLHRFSRILKKRLPNLEWKHWRSAHRMIEESAPFLPKATLISLDHDLDPWEGDNQDPGDGVILVRWLVNHKQSCPVIIHSSNRERSDWMAGELELAGWKYRRVAPIGEDWIEEYWIHIARKLLARKSRKDR